MITKQQALEIWAGQELHCEVGRACEMNVSPHGHLRHKTIKVRVSGQCKTWKREPNRFRLPVKHGLFQSTAVTELNCEQFHLPADCPALLH